VIDGLKPYAIYKNSGLRWIGEIPSHWDLQRAKWLFRRMDRPVRDSDEVVTCFRDGTVTLRKNRRLRGFTESLKEIGYQGIRRGDLVIHAMDAFAGAVGVSDSDGKGTPVYSVCEPASNANAHYYAHLVGEMARSQWILALATGIRERSTDFRFEGFASQLVPLPPLAEQNAIVRFLEHSERQIKRYVRTKKKLIALLNEQKQAAIYYAVTRGLNSEAPHKPSGILWLGEIPQHWDVWQLGHFARVGNGSTPSRGNSAYWIGGTYPWLNSSSVNRSPISGSDQFVTELALRECHLPRVQPRSVLVAITGQGKTRGTAAVLDTEATINQHIVYITPRRDVVSAEYLQLALIGAYRELRSISDDSGSTKGALTCADIAHFRIALPDLDEQESIVRAVRDSTQSLEAAIVRSQREMALLSDYRARLVSDVVIGQVDVREAALHLTDAPATEDEGFLDEDTAEDEPAELDDAETAVTA
jgi:type I restriction enzyme, S subunit